MDESAESTTAASLVFGTTELLELILIHLPWQHLFVLKSVNTRFNDLITNKCTILRRRMCLEPPTNPHEPVEWPAKSIVSPFLTEGRLSWGTFYGFDWHMESAGLVFNVNYPVWNPEHEDTPMYQGAIGIKGTSQSGTYTQGSWRLTKLSSFPFRVCVRISVSWDKSMPEHWDNSNLFGWPHYQDRVTLHIGSTLGDLIQVLHEVHNRSFQEHIILWATQYRNARPGVVRYARDIRIRSRQACSACRWWKGLHEQNGFDDGAQHHWCCLEQDHPHCGQCEFFIDGRLSEPNGAKDWRPESWMVTVLVEISLDSP